MTSIDVGGDFSGQMAAGSILNVGVCPGKELCPFERSEATRQRQFEKMTGIACCAGARKALEHLLDSETFDYKQLSAAWRNSSLKWDSESLLLEAKYSAWEFYYGCVMMIGGFLTSLSGVLALIFHGNAPLTMQLVFNCLLMVSTAFLIPVAARYLVWPNRIAKRAKPFLKEYYQQSA